MDAKRKILILGGSSYVGRHLFESFGADRAVATYCSTPIEGGVRFDSLTMSLTDAIHRPSDFSHAVVLLGDTQPDSCFADPRRSRALNVDSIASILDQLKAMAIKPIFASSEFVFDGAKGRYVETDEPRPILLYGTQKLEAENHLKSLGIPHAILRLAKVFGDTSNDGTLFTGWLAGIREGAVLRCATDQLFSPVYVGDVVTAIKRTVDLNLEGTYHVSGNREFSRMELLDMLLEKLGRQYAPRVRVEPCSIHDFPLPEKRPVNVSMVSDKLAQAAGMSFSDIESLCGRIVKQSLM